MSPPPGKVGKRCGRPGIVSGDSFLRHPDAKEVSTPLASVGRPALFILCPPRSFSSVVCAMLGQHPDLYGFPELNLFAADTVAGLRRFHLANRCWLETSFGFPPGLLRALAQLLYGSQQSIEIGQARAWLRCRQHWSVGRLLDFLLDRAEPRLGVDKSPMTVLSPQFLERAFALNSRARFLHLTRHPVSAHRSLGQAFQARLERAVPGMDAPGRANFFARLWWSAHQRILQFTEHLPADQTMRIRGEDLLAEPEVHFPRITAWLGLSMDSSTMEAIKHPEASPFAHFGPEAARGGNDFKFLQDPQLRPVGRPPGLRTVADDGIDRRLHALTLELAGRLGYG